MIKLVSLHFVISSFIFKFLIQYFLILCSCVFNLYHSSVSESCHDVCILFLLLLCGFIVHISFRVMSIFLVLFLNTSKILMMVRANTICTLFQFLIIECVCLIATTFTNFVIVLLLCICQNNGFW